MESGLKTYSCKAFRIAMAKNIKANAAITI
jgi:hypothetical protein